MIANRHFPPASRHPHVAPGKNINPHEVLIETLLLGATVLGLAAAVNFPPSHAEGLKPSGRTVVHEAGVPGESIIERGAGGLGGNAVAQ